MQQFIGYRTRLWARTAYLLLVCVTGGAAWLIAYTFPRAILWTLEECNLADADHVLAKVLPLACTVLCCEVIHCSAHHLQPAGCVLSFSADSIYAAAKKTSKFSQACLVQLFDGQKQLVKVYQIPNRPRSALVSCLHTSRDMHMLNLSLLHHLTTPAADQQTQYPWQQQQCVQP